MIALLRIIHISYSLIFFSGSKIIAYYHQSHYIPISIDLIYIITILRIKNYISLHPRIIFKHKIR